MAPKKTPAAPPPAKDKSAKSKTSAKDAKTAKEPEAPKEKPKNIDDLLKNLHKKYGDASVERLTGRAIKKVETFSSGAISLDHALGAGGYAFGRVYEIFGPESCGKTTLTLHAIAECQALGLNSAFVDAEHALDMAYAQALGVDTDALLFCQPDYGEQALNVVEDIAESGQVSLIVVDSVAALTPKAEIDGEVGDFHVGAQSRMMSQAMRKLVGIASKNKVTIIFINQIRMKIGVIYGSPETTPGGQALKFYASVRLDVRRKTQLKENDQAMGNQTLVKVIKNKLAPPFREAELDIIWGKGVDKIGSLVSLAVDTGIVEKSGSFYSYDNERIGQGFNTAVKAIAADSVLFNKIDADVRKVIFK